MSVDGRRSLTVPLTVRARWSFHLRRQRLHRIYERLTQPISPVVPDLFEWAWMLCADDSFDPVADARAGSRHAGNWRHTFGRFRVASWGSTDVALLIRHVDTPVYALRLN